MEIHARQIAVAGEHGWLLPPTSLRIGTGQLALVGCGNIDPTAFALTFSARMEPTSGAVLLNGAGDPFALRDRIAVVDAPDVTSPEPALPLSAVVAEELAYAGAAADRVAVGEWLDDAGAAQYAQTRFELVPPELRTDLLTELAAQRQGVDVLVLVAPDRHGGNPDDWWAVAVRHARQGTAVVLLCADPATALFSVPSARLGRLDQPPPVQVTGPEQSANGQYTESLDGTLPNLAEDMQ